MLQSITQVFCKLSCFLYQSCFCGSYLRVQGPQLLLISSQQKRWPYIKDRDSIEQQVFEERYPFKLKFGNLGSVWNMKLINFSDGPKVREHCPTTRYWTSCRPQARRRTVERISFGSCRGKD